MKNVKKIIEVKLMGLNELGVKELNDFYKYNLLFTLKAYSILDGLNQFFWEKFLVVLA